MPNKTTLTTVTRDEGEVGFSLSTDPDQLDKVYGQWARQYIRLS